jgi:Tfp pilus assembly protein PilO
MIWRERRVLLIILGVLLFANMVFFFTYRVQYQSRLQALDDRLAQAEGQLEQARTARIRAEQTYRSYKQIETDVDRIYNQHWATQSERLTAMIAEVKRLTVASSLVPTTITFNQSEVLVKKAAVNAPRRVKRDSIGATEVSITFGVQGTYQQVRRLINLLELSHQFVIISQISLAARDGQNLDLSLLVKTLFREDDARTASSDPNTRL